MPSAHTSPPPEGIFFFDAETLPDRFRMQVEALHTTYVCTCGAHAVTEKDFLVHAQDHHGTIHSYIVKGDT